MANIKCFLFETIVLSYFYIRSIYIIKEGVMSHELWRKNQTIRLKRYAQEDLAKIINVHRATIGKYENNERFPDLEYGSLS